MVVNTHYKDNLKAVMQVAKKYTDDKIEQALELLEDYELSSETISQTSQTATAPSDVRASSLIEVGGNCVKYAPSTASDNSVAYKKSIPNNTYKLFADKIGGMSYKSENLIVLNDVAETTTNGVTYKIENGIITLNGTATSSFTITFVLYADIPSGTYYSNFFTDNNALNFDLYFNGTSINVSDLSQQPLSFNTSVHNMLIYIASGKIYNNYVCKPMLVKGSTAPTTWSEGFTGIRNTAVSQLTIRSANLLNLSNVVETTVDGITYSITNGVLSVRGTATQRVEIRLMSYTFKVGNYSVKVFDIQNLGSVNVRFFADAIMSSSNLTSTTLSNTFSVQNEVTSDFGFVVPSGANVNATFKYMLVKGSTAPSEYKPYVTPIIKNIPSQIQALDGYGWGINDTCYNYIDFERKVFVQKVGRYNAGTFNYTVSGSGLFYFGVPSTFKPSSSNDVPQSDKLLCALYEIVNASTHTGPQGQNPSPNMTMCYNTNGNIYFNNTSYTDATAFKNAMNGVYLYYELATPIETDVSQYLADFNPIETNDLYGEIEFVNTYNQDMPNEISFVGTIKETLVTSFTIGNETTNITDSIESDGWSASSTVFNTRKTRDRERTKRVGRVDLGSLTYFYDSANNRFTVTIDNIKNVLQTEVPNAMCCCYDILAFNTIIANPTRDLVIGFNTSGVMTIKNFAYTDETNFKNAMSGVYLYYELATPEVTTLDVDTDFHYIDLESGETITFNNANNQACHNTIRYSIMEEKV